MVLERRRSGLRQATKTDKMPSKKIKDVRKQDHSNKNYTYCGLMTDLGLIMGLQNFVVIIIRLSLGL